MYLSDKLGWKVQILRLLRVSYPEPVFGTHNYIFNKHVNNSQKTLQFSVCQFLGSNALLTKLKDIPVCILVRDEGRPRAYNSYVISLVSTSKL